MSENELKSGRLKQLELDIVNIKKLYGVTREALKHFLTYTSHTGRPQVYFTIEDSEWLPAMPANEVLNLTTVGALYRHNLVATVIFAAQALDGYLRAMCGQVPAGKDSWDRTWFNLEVLTIIVGFPVHECRDYHRVQSLLNTRDVFVGTRPADATASISHEHLISYLDAVIGFATDFDLGFQQCHPGIRP